MQDIHTIPDDSNAVLDRGAMMTTAPPPSPHDLPGMGVQHSPSRTRNSHPLWQHGNRARRRGLPHRILRPIDRPQSISYRTRLRARDVAAGHVVTFTHHEAIISDIGSAYTLRIPRIPDSREWRVPLHLLERLTDLRAAHSLHHEQVHSAEPSTH